MIPEAAVEAAAKAILSAMDRAWGNRVDIYSPTDVAFEGRLNMQAAVTDALKAAEQHMYQEPWGDGFEVGRKEGEVTAFIAREIELAENADAFADYARGWMDALKMVNERLAK